MKNAGRRWAAAALCAVMLASTAGAAELRHTVAAGDTMWKLAVKYEVGTGEIIAANRQVADPDLIYPGQVLVIPRVDSQVLDYEAEVVRLVNRERAKNGLKPLTVNWELARVARFKSQDMKDKKYFSHTSPTYGSPFQMILNFGLSYRTAGENIARGYATPEAVMKGWMNSPSHRENILKASYRQIGVGYVPQGSYWTQEFIG